MTIKGLVDEDFANYKKASMFICFPKCSFKCDRDSGQDCCQNSSLAHSPDINISMPEIVQRYIDNPITSAIVFGGLEPFDTPGDMLVLAEKFRKVTDDDIVIYTGYNELERPATIDCLSRLKNIIVKFGRFIPNREHRFDEVLGVELASDNQYARRLEYVDQSKS